MNLLDPFGAGRSWARIGGAATILLILAIHVAGRIGAFCCPYRADSYLYAGLGYRMAHGDVLYRDIWVDKPPGLMWVYAATYRIAGGPPTRMPLIVTESIGMLLGYFAVYALARELHGKAAAACVAIAAALAINYFSVFDFTTEGFGLAENYLVATAAASVLYYIRGYRRRRALDFLAAGLFLGLSGMLKQTAVAVVAAILVHALCLAVARRDRMWWKPALCLIAGGVLAVAPFAFVCVMQGTLPSAARDIALEGYPHLQLSTAFPAQWRDVFPLWVPLIWLPLGLIGWLECRDAGAGGPSAPRLAAIDLLLLLFWTTAEWILIYKLTRRAFHFYVTACIPVILLSGVFWWALSRAALAGGRMRASAFSAWLIALTGSAFGYLPVVHELAPCALRRWRSYDRAADDEFMRLSMEGLKDFVPSSGKYVPRGQSP